MASNINRQADGSGRDATEDDAEQGEGLTVETPTVLTCHLSHTLLKPFTSHDSPPITLLLSGSTRLVCTCQC